MPKTKIAKVKVNKQKRVMEKSQEITKNKEKILKYKEGIGRRKTSTARVRLFLTRPQESAEAGNFYINGRPYKEYFKDPICQLIVESALRKLKSLNRFGVSVKVSGGGFMSQAEAIRHGMARALVLFDSNYKKKLKKAGYLTRDPRMKERKKYGLRGARKRKQWSKR